MSLLSKIRFEQSQPPAGGDVVRTIDLHTGGEPLRVIIDGLPRLPAGISVLEARRRFRESFDHWRTALMYEPRGHADMYGCVLVEPNDADADFGIVFLHNDGYSTMCGHAIIAVSTLVFQMGWKEPTSGTNTLVIDAPCGRIISETTLQDNRITGVRFRGVPSFVIALDRTISVPGLGNVVYDLAYGGAFYAIVELTKNDLPFRLQTDAYRRIIDAGRDIKQAIAGRDTDITHPDEPDLGFLYGTIFTDRATDSDRHSRNVCVFANGEVDRSPTGSGVSARLAVHYARQEIGIGQPIRIESLIGTEFCGQVMEESDCGPWPAIIPQVSGTAHITGRHEFWLDATDPLKDGFFLR